MTKIVIIFGVCGIDKEKCYPNGCICRLNKIAGFTTDFDYSNPQKDIPFRNKKCCHFKNNNETMSDFEKYSCGIKHDK